MPHKRHLTDWVKIKNEYVIGKLDASTGERIYPLQSDLARKYDVSEASISLHCNKENWQQERDEYLKSVQDELKKKTKKFEAGSLEQVLKEDLQIIRLAKVQWLKNKKQAVDGGKSFDVYDRDMIQFMKLEKEILEVIHGTDDVSRLQETQVERPAGLTLADLIAIWKLGNRGK
jgi:hypothetical protein